MADTPSFSSLPPEMNHIICGKLTRHDLTTCARICKSINSSTTSLIWEGIRLKNHEQFESFLTPEAQLAFRRYSANVRKLILYMYHASFLDTLFSTDDNSMHETALCTNLSSLEICDHLDKYIVDNVPNAEYLTMDLVRQNPNLTEY
ncbi:hypothetical protein BG000_005423, partial [Podila horticola]